MRCTVKATCSAPIFGAGLKFRLLNLSAPSVPSSLGKSAVACILNELAALCLFRPGDLILMFESRLR